jgi:hypothetical protein
MPPIGYCVQHADELAQEVVNAWAANMQAGSTGFTQYVYLLNSLATMSTLKMASIVLVLVRHYPRVFRWGAHPDTCAELDSRQLYFPAQYLSR